MSAAQAIHAPGRSVEDVIADRDRSKKRVLRMQFAMTQDQSEQVMTTLDDVPYVYCHAASVFDLFREGVQAGWFGADHPGVTAVCELASIALRHKADTDGAILEDLGRALLLAKTGQQKSDTDQEEDQ